MGRSHNGTLLPKSPRIHSVSLAWAALVMLAACLLILATPLHIYADELKSLEFSNSATLPQTSMRSSWGNSGATKLAEQPSTDLTSRASKGFIYLIGVLLLGVTLAKKFNRKQSSVNQCEIEILAKRALSPKHALVMVEVEGERLLLAQSAENLSFITKLRGESFNGALSDLIETSQTASNFSEHSDDRLYGEEQSDNDAIILRRAGMR